MHMITEAKNGLCSTKCGGRNLSFFDCTVWWRDVTCPLCKPLVRPKRRKLVKG